MGKQMKSGPKATRRTTSKAKSQVLRQPAAAAIDPGKTLQDLADLAPRRAELNAVFTELYENKPFSQKVVTAEAWERWLSEPSRSYYRVNCNSTNLRTALRVQHIRDAVVARGGRSLSMRQLADDAKRLFP